MATPLAEELRAKISILADLADDDLEWLCEHGTLIEMEPGDSLIREGDPADALFFMLKGEVQIRRADSGIESYFIVREGDISGALPYSRMTQWNGTGYAVLPSRALRLAKDQFKAMVQQIPALGGRLIAVMTDRVREVTKADLQRDKLLALGKLSAGLAHELNNPASAGKRAAEQLRSALLCARDASRRLFARALTGEQRVLVMDIEDASRRRTPEAAGIDALTRSDLEDTLAAWITSRGIDDGWRLAPALVDAGLDSATLAPLIDKLGVEATTDALERITATATIAKLADEIDSATGRISEIVRSIKEYSYMDQAPVQEIDLHAGIESTLLILAHKVKVKSATIERHFATDIPPMLAYGRELNQVWTNLLDNALDAIEPGGHIEIVTCRRLGLGITVEVIDNGAGISAEIRPHIFEPFYTTKGVGEGTGLGLDAVYHIVRKHHGDIRVDSQPGRTKFSVDLPLDPVSGSAATP